MLQYRSYSSQVKVQHNTGLAAIRGDSFADGRCVPTTSTPTASLARALWIIITNEKDRLPQAEIDHMMHMAEKFRLKAVQQGQD